MTDPHLLRAAVEADDWAAVEALLHPDVQFRSPAVFTPYEWSWSGPSQG